MGEELAPISQKLHKAEQKAHGPLSNSSRAQVGKWYVRWDRNVCLGKRYIDLKLMTRLPLLRFLLIKKMREIQ
jgi:hypothetical protein